MFEIIKHVIIFLGYLIGVSFFCKDEVGGDKFYVFLREICETSSILKIIYFINQLLDILLTIVPIGLILMILVDFFKNIVNQNDEFQKNFQMALKRILMAVSLFFVPTIVQFTMTLLGDLGVDFMKCFTNVNIEKIASFEAVEKVEQKEEQSASSGKLPMEILLI